jgi:potassium channel subfamily K
VRYIIALPLSIILWILASAMLIADLTVMNERSRPSFPTQIYSGGFWYGLEAAVIYLMLAIALLVNLLGYVRGHYPQHFELTKDQRTLVVQTMMYFIWLAGGAGVFVACEGFTYADSVSNCASQRCMS